MYDYMHRYFALRWDFSYIKQKGITKMSVELKIRSLCAEEIAEVCGGELIRVGSPESDTVSKISHDSRDGGENTLFCAIVGEKFDGHDFICDCVKSGTSVVLLSSLPENTDGLSFYAIKVEDTVVALGTLASYYRNFSKAKFIGVTGSVGKTTTKEFIYAVSSVAYKTHKTKGNLNNEIGLPLTLFDLSPEDEVSVIEMGMSNLGEIEYMSKLVRPDIAVITNIGTSHLASLGTRENICKAKMEIASGLKKDGTLIINADEPLLFAYRGNVVPEPEFISVYNRFGDFRAVNIRRMDEGMMFDLIYNNKAVTNVEIPALGKHNVYNALISYSVGVKLGMTDDQIRRGLLNFVSTDKRQNIYEVGGITVIDDCYNASPESMRAAIDVLTSMAQRKNVRPCALLGDMLELGEYSRLMHDQLGQYAAQMKVQKLYCYGSMADVLAEAAIKKGVRAENVYVSLDSDNPADMAKMINASMEDGDILLVKASRAVSAERVIEALRTLRTKKK